ncbi:MULTISPECIES: type VI secretion system-associated protein TagO [unclassified Aurantimonas]|uniref:type VI secretion system-associated protein TagO n=1 Tax=unclassified Aurantimonas TaxID=2638230 RepID=UPI002E1719EE|nr:MULTISPECIES: type VI secretion system-associated protein TagO [unclassified Aurantimonas]MEC5292993.1 type VI secretion system-associated protein TagO [Aurantimonas sp. C2-3-R2]MEC5414002.1 type VI secretion system-associated protein TagO [Aurantimonas sp. C2-4-R8]
MALIQEAKDSYTDRYGGVGRANLQVVCQENRTGLALVLPELYTSHNGNLGTVTFRVDSGTAFDREMVSANDHGSLAVLGGQAISAIKEMLDGDKLVVRFITVNEGSMVTTFSLAGLADQIGSVRETCGW